MKSVAQFAAFRAMRILIGGTIAAAAYLALIILGPIIETRFFPVTKFTQMVQLRDGDKVHIDATFNKIRACEYVNGQWFGRTASFSWRDIDVNYHNTARGFTRPVGKNYDRDWELDLPDDDHGIKQIYLLLTYRCGLPWMTQTLVGPYPLAGAS